VGCFAEVKILLDTHIWLWGLLSPDRLGKRLRRHLAAKQTELWLSPISVWEALLLIEKGRIVVDDPAPLWVEKALASADYYEAPLTYQVAQRSRRIQLPHQDPADRFLAATAHVYDLTLATADKSMLKGTGFRCLPNA